jgi:hypothetical protein
MTFYLSATDLNIFTIITKFKKKLLFVGTLEAIEEKIRIQFRIRIQNRYLVLRVGDPDP